MLRFILSLRFVMLVAPLGALAGALAMFWTAVRKLTVAFHVLLAPAEEAKQVVPLVMSATDALLFGILLVIIAYAVTFTFILDLSEENWRKVPRWARIHTIGALENTMVEMILVYLIVDFVTDIGDTDGGLSWETLIKPASILMIAAAHRLVSSRLGEPPGR